MSHPHLRKRIKEIHKYIFYEIPDFEIRCPNWILKAGPRNLILKALRSASEDQNSNILHTPRLLQSPGYKANRSLLDVVRVGNWHFGVFHGRVWTTRLKDVKHGRTSAGAESWWLTSASLWCLPALEDMGNTLAHRESVNMSSPIREIYFLYTLGY